MSSPRVSDPMDWQFDALSTPRQSTQQLLPAVTRRTTTIDDFHPSVHQAFFPVANIPPSASLLQTRERMNRVDFNPNRSHSPVHYTIFNEEQRRPPALPTGPRAVPVSGSPVSRARFLSRQTRPQPSAILRNMHTTETLQTSGNQGFLLQTAHRILEETRRRRYQTSEEVENRISLWRLDSTRRSRTIPAGLRSARITTRPEALQQALQAPPSHSPRHDLANPNWAPLLGPPGAPRFPSATPLPVDAQNNPRPILPLPARVQSRSSPNFPVRVQPGLSSPASRPTRPSIPTPPSVLRKRVLAEYQDEAPDAETEERSRSPTARLDNGLNEIVMAGTPESDGEGTLELNNGLSDDDIMEDDLFVPGSWPAPPRSSLMITDGSNPPLRNTFQQLQDAVTSVATQIRNAHTLIMRINTSTRSIHRKGRESVQHVVRGAVEMAGTVKRRAVEFYRSRARASSERFNLARDRRNLRVLTPEERIRQRARGLGIGQGINYPPTVSPRSTSQSAHRATLPSSVEEPLSSTSPTSPTASSTRYPGSGRDLTPVRPNKTNRPPERRRSSPVFNTDDKSPSRARKQRSLSKSPPNIQKLQLGQEYLNSTAFTTPSSPVQHDVASSSHVETSSPWPQSSAPFDVFNPWSQQHYADLVPEPEPVPEQHPDQCTEQELLSMPEQQSHTVPAAPESVSSDNLPDGLFIGTIRAVKKKVNKMAVRWVDDASPLRPISEIRLFRSESRIDSPLRHELRLEPGDAEGETNRPLAVPRRVFVKALPPKWEKKVDEAIRLPNSHQLGTTPGGDPLTRRDLATCYQPLAWLNDEVINAYLAVIINFLRQESEASSNEQPRHHAFNTFFFSNLRDKGYGSVRRWASRAKIGKENLLGVEIVLVPIHHHSHWTLLVVRPAARTIEHFDSLGGMSRAHVALIQEWLRQELGDKYVEEEWTVLPTRSPQQNNGSDCGVFLLTTAKLRALNLDPLSYGAKDIPLIRKRIVGELMNGGFGGDLDPVEGRSSCELVPLLLETSEGSLWRKG